MTNAVASSWIVLSDSASLVIDLGLPRAGRELGHSPLDGGLDYAGLEDVVAEDAK